MLKILINMMNCSNKAEDVALRLILGKQLCRQNREIEGIVSTTL